MKVKISVVVALATLIAAAWAYGDGFNMVSWPLLPHNTSIQAVMAESLGTGCQLTGGFFDGFSDQVRYWTGSAWVYAWYDETNWQGSLTAIEPDKGYWILIRSFHNPVTLTMTGAVSDTARIIPILDSATEVKWTMVGASHPKPCSLSGTSGDDANLIASGFTGGFFDAFSDQVRYWTGSGWLYAWHDNTNWQGTLKVLEPGNGYWMRILAGNGFINDQWIYPIPPDYSKGGKALSVSRVRPKAPAKVVTGKATKLRSQGPATNMSMNPDKAVEVKKSR